MKSNLSENVEIFSNHYISRFKQLLDNDQVKDAYATFKANQENN